MAGMRWIEAAGIIGKSKFGRTGKSRGPLVQGRGGKGACAVVHTEVVRPRRPACLSCVSALIFSSIVSFVTYSLALNALLFS
jgi:hypothetical protein